MEIAVDLVADLADKLRSDAKRLEDDKERLIRKIESLQELIRTGNMPSLTDAQRDDALCHLNRAFKLSQTVQVSIHPMMRDKAQQFANMKVTSLLNDLERDVKRNPSSSRLKVMSYMNACCSSQIGEVPPDEPFGDAIVGCTLDDQKQAKKRIKVMLEYVDQ